MSAFAQTTTGDFDISTGNLRVEANVAQITAWKLSNLFAFFKGEWFCDTRLGIPYFQYVFVQNPNLNLIGSIFERVLHSPPGVASVDQLSLDYRPGLRTLATDFKCTAVTGETLTGGLGSPFIVAVKQG